MTSIAKTMALAGYRDVTQMLTTLLIPALAVAAVSDAVIFLLKLHWMYLLVPPMICMFGVLGVIGVKSSGRKRDMDANLHLFITYAGTIATMKITRGLLFRRIAQKRVFGEISKTCEKILYLAHEWKLGYAETCRRISKKVPSKIFADFLDRFAIVMDFGEDLEVFLVEEQESVMEDFETEYKKSLESIKLIQELFIAVMVGLSFLLSIGILAPLLIDISMTTIMAFAFVAFITLDLFIIVLVISFIPSDKILHGLKQKNVAMNNIITWTVISTLIGIMAAMGLLLYTQLPVLIIIAIAVTPLLIPGFLASAEEKRVLERDRLFPVYARTLGAAIEVRNGGVVSALKSTQVHDFSLLNQMSINLHRRLRLGCDKFKSWHAFAVESGSNMIHHFSRIFSESIYLGGNAGKIGELISKNLMRLISLRRLRLQLSQGMKGAVYGSLIGLTAVLYVSLSVSQQLIGLFKSPANLDSQMTALINAIVPHASGEANFTQALMLIGILLVIHSAALAIVLKLIDGGSLHAAAIDFVSMVWICAVLSWILPSATSKFMPNVGGIFGT